MVGGGGGVGGVFFFQAEDGIRDIGVTGVQTCALPISKPKLVRLMSVQCLLFSGTGVFNLFSDIHGKLIHNNPHKSVELFL